MDKLFVVPPRAPFKAEPKGLGTWQRQRLSSYLLDVAAAACVRPQAILNSYIDWRQDKRSGRFGKNMRLELINGSGPFARMWTSAISPLVGRDDLEDLTLLPFAHVMSAAPAAMSQWRRWCPHCLYGDAVSGGDLYERLLWSISYVTVCPLHQTRLVSSCPSCGISQSSELSRHTLSGFCGACKGWLGRERSTDDMVDLDTPVGAYEIWVAKDFANLLALNRDGAALLSRKKSMQLLSAVVATTYGGNRGEFCKHANIGKPTLESWLKNGGLPTLRSMVRLSWVLQIPMRSLLMGNEESDITIKRSGVSAEFLPPRPRRKNRRARDWIAIERNLRESIDSDRPYSSWQEAARELGFVPSNLRWRFPQLAEQIIEAGKQRRREAAQTRQEQRRIAIEEATEKCIRELISCEIYPRGMTVRQELQKLGLGLDWFTAGKVISAALDRLTSEIATLRRRTHSRD